MQPVITNKEKIDRVKEYLEQFGIAKENLKTIAELDQVVADEFSSSKIGSRSYSVVGGGHTTGRTDRPVVNADLLSERCREKVEQNQKIMDEIVDAISLLGVTKGRNLLEEHFLLGYTWRKVETRLGISKNTRLTHSKKAMIQLYNLLSKQGKI